MALLRPDPAHPSPLDAPPLPGFEHINRYWDRQSGVMAAKLLPGEYYVTRRDELVTTVLGSCISACVCDSLARVGGMNHFMLPDFVEGATGSWAAADTGAATRYGNFAMEHMINDVLKAGGRRDRMEFKVFGGGRVLRLDIDVADRNVAFALDYIASERLRLLSRDVGGPYPRKVNFFPLRGKAFVKKLTRMHNDTVEKRERQYLKTIEKAPAVRETAGVEFF